MLTTEEINPATRDLDTLGTLQILERMADQDALVPLAVRKEILHIAAAVDLIVDRLERGGRLFYFGAGTSGRLGVLDAAECRPTFSVPPEQVQAFIAGGSQALTNSVEAVEDDQAAGRATAEAAGINANDAVVGIAASGVTPYVIGALGLAHERGAATISLVSNLPSPLADLADVTIAPITGPETVSGSTRLKAGTAQKLVLNMLSTTSMVRLGKVYGNLMVDVQPTNRKLRERARRIVAAASGVSFEQAGRLLTEAGYQVKTAVVMALAAISAAEAQAALARSGGHVRRAVAAAGQSGPAIEVSETTRFITGGRVYAAGRVLPNGVVAIAGSRILAVGTPDEVTVPEGAERIDARGLAVVPGLIDLHIHGIAGWDAMAGQVADMAAELPRFGVTAFLPTTLAAPHATTRAALEKMSGALGRPAAGARPLGVHMEGPYLSPAMPGMMDTTLFEALTWSAFAALNAAAGGRVRMLTFAPEVGEAMQTIPRLLAAGVVPSIGHTAATYVEVEQAVRLGLSHATHTYNAMRPFHHREPGTVGAVWQFDEITAQLVADGHHVHPAAMKVLLRLKTPERVSLVSDAVPPAGLPAGNYEWCGANLIGDGQTLRLANGQLAGSASPLNLGLRGLVELAGLSLEQALITATRTPARVLQLPKGQLAAGYDADLVILGDDYAPVLTMVEGQVVYQSGRTGGRPL